MGGSRVEERRPERERYHWLMRCDGRQEVVAGNNYIGAARVRIICVGVANIEDSIRYISE